MYLLCHSKDLEFMLSLVADPNSEHYLRHVVEDIWGVCEVGMVFKTKLPVSRPQFEYYCYLPLKIITPSYIGLHLC